MSSQYPKKCKCGQHNGMACKNCSRVRMKFMLTHEYKNASRIAYNPTFYCKIKRNNFTDQSIAKEMIEKLPEIPKFKTYYQNSNLIIFYNNFSGTEIQRQHLK